MAGLPASQAAEAARLSEPASNEAKILSPNKVRDEAVQEMQSTAPELPKLSAAEYRIYNSMAEHMEYFVRRKITR